MNDTLKWVLIGVGAYLLYEQYAATPAAITTGGTAAPIPTPAPSTTTTAAAPTPAQAQAQAYLATLNAKGPNAILAAAHVPASQLYTASQWNYYLPALGVAQPDLSRYGMDATTAVSIGAWWSALIAYYTAAANSSTGLGRLGAPKKPALPLIPVTFDLKETGW